MHHEVFISRDDSEISGECRFLLKTVSWVQHARVNDSKWVVFVPPSRKIHLQHASCQIGSGALTIASILGL